MLLIKCLFSVASPALPCAPVWHGPCPNLCAMKKVITFIATLFLFAGLPPATSSLLAQDPRDNASQDNTYRPYPGQGAPPTYQEEGPDQQKGPPTPPPGHQEPP